MRVKLLTFCVVSRATRVPLSSLTFHSQRSQSVQALFPTDARAHSLHFLNSLSKPEIDAILPQNSNVGTNRLQHKRASYAPTRGRCVVITLLLLFPGDADSALSANSVTPTLSFSANPHRNKTRCHVDSLLHSVSKLHTEQTPASTSTTYLRSRWSEQQSPLFNPVPYLSGDILILEDMRR